GQRAAATGRAALTPEYAGLAILGSFAPGPVTHGWNDPLPEVAAREPALLRDRGRLPGSALRLALASAAERPGFHALRMTASALYLLRTATASVLTWSIGAPEVLPAERQPAGAALFPWAWRGLVAELVLLQGLFLAALWVAPRRGPPAVRWLTAAVLLKIAIHTVAGAQGRHLLPAFAWQILVIALAANAWPGARRRAVAGLAGGAAVAAALALGAPWLVRRVEARAHQGQRVYQFPLVSPDGRVELDCEVREGRLTALAASRAAIAPLRVDPEVGEAGRAQCQIRRAAGALHLRIADRHAQGGYPDHLEQRVEIDGRTVWRRDLAAEPGTGWAPVNLTPGSAGSISFVVAVLRPAPSPGWGESAITEFVLEPQPGGAQ
ncbi:MAG TPA: hypothetical protein VFE44_04155, partial [Thermoanaerobaculia bacterium]|nr:hypothetical protein [Thermoanaerobaculia bacterium]